MKKDDGCNKAAAFGVLLFQICHSKSREPYAEFYDFATTMHQEHEIYEELGKQVQKFTASSPTPGVIAVNASIFPDLNWGLMMHKFNWVFIGELISAVREEPR
jgi:hypothetical protein